SAEAQIQRIQNHVTTQKEEEDKQLLEQISTQIRADESDLPHDFTSKMEKLHGFTLSVRQVTGRHPALQPLALPIQDAINQQLAVLRTWQRRQQLDEISQAINEMGRKEKEEEAITCLQEINKLLARLAQEGEGNAGD